MPRNRARSRYMNLRKRSLCVDCEEPSEDIRCDECQAQKVRLWAFAYQHGDCRACSHKRTDDSPYCVGHKRAVGLAAYRARLNAVRKAEAEARTDRVVDYILASLRGVPFRVRDLPRELGRNAIRRALTAGVADGFLEYEGAVYRLK